MKKRIYLLLTFTVVLLADSSLFACAVCGGGGYKKATLDAYMGSTIILTLTPFIMMGIIGTWVYRKKKAEAQDINEN